MSSIGQAKLNLSNLNVILKGRQGQLDRMGSAMARAAGDGFEYEANPNHPYTAVGYVQTGTARARRAQAREHRLERSLDAARGVE